MDRQDVSRHTTVCNLCSGQEAFQLRLTSVLQLFLPRLHPRRIVSLRHLNATLTQQYRDALHRHAGLKQSNSDRVSKAVDSRRLELPGPTCLTTAISATIEFGLGEKKKGNENGAELPGSRPTRSSSNGFLPLEQMVSGANEKCNVMTKEAVLQIRLSREQRDRFFAECKRRGLVPSGIARSLLEQWCGSEPPQNSPALDDGMVTVPGIGPDLDKVETKTETISPVPRFDWQLPGYPWRKLCPTCGGQPNPASFCTTCVNNGYIFDFTN